MTKLSKTCDIWFKYWLLIGWCCFVQSQLDADKSFSLDPYMDHINRLFSGSSLEEIFQALESEGSDWSIKNLEVRNCFFKNIHGSSASRCVCVLKHVGLNKETWTQLSSHILVVSLFCQYFCFKAVIVNRPGLSSLRGWGHFYFAKGTFIAEFL